MLSHLHKFIYVHIPKTAGTSIETAFGHHEPGRLNQDHRTIREIEPLSNVLRNLHRTETLEALAKRGRNQFRRLTDGYFETATPAQYDSYFRFAIVRNPWDRCLSWYKNVMRNDWLRKPLGIDESCSFDYFMRNYQNQWGLRPQTYWVENSAGAVSLDYVGRFEQLEDAFDHICTRIGVTRVELPKMLVKHGRTDYRTEYDDSLKEYVGRLYAREIELFDYQFSGSE